MKKLLCCFLLASFCSVVSAVEMKPFLLENYGWTIDLGNKEKNLFGFSWNISCTRNGQILPREGVNVFRFPVCTQKDRTFWTVILWRTNMVAPEAIEKTVYNAMSDGLGHGKILCREEPQPSLVNEKGVVRDCAVPLQHGTFYVSFYHFDIPMPAGGSFVDQNGEKEKTLGFTIWVQNAGNIDNGVKDKIRELISAIKGKE